MNCEHAQQEILLADDPGAVAATRPEIAEHVKGCAECAALAEKLAKLELAAQALPVKGMERPLPIMAERIANEAATSRIGYGQGAKVRQEPGWGAGRWRRVLRGAVAAATIIVAGLIALTMMTSTRTARADAVFKDLVEWNVRISQADAASRSRVYQAELAAMQKEVALLTGDDKKIANQLLSNAESMVSGNDPITEARHFGEIAAQFEQRETSLADQAAAARLRDLREYLAKQGIQNEINRVNSTSLTPEQQSALDNLRQQIQHHVPQQSASAGPMLTPMPRIPAGGGGIIHVRPATVNNVAPPVNPMHDFVPPAPFRWSQGTTSVIVTLPGKPANNGTQTPASAKPSTLPANEQNGGLASGGKGGTASDNANELLNLPPITQAAGGAGGSGGGITRGKLGDLPDMSDFESAPAAGKGSQPSVAEDWGWGTKGSDVLNGSLPGWMKCDNHTNVADMIPVSDGGLNDDTPASGPDGSPLTAHGRHGTSSIGFLDFAGTTGTAAVGAISGAPEPAAGVLLGLGTALLLRRRKSAK
ncbi:MAG TPA: PEP-CTERM sorting domain-containing protein [Phycisphaerae bacterium]|nr:PEP-CTERM sorting domain-containing protein [Phycisphaerae bacterium]